MKRKPSVSEKASFSRATRRLHDRGLLERVGKSIELYDFGRAVAAKILGEVDPYPTEADYQLAFFPGKSIEQITEERETEKKAFLAGMQRFAKIGGAA